jgi:hypothetical protein
MTVHALYKKVISLEAEIEKICYDVIDQALNEIRSYNLQQMLDGETNTGQFISPSYQNDPFFKTREAAEAYSRWKDKISPPSTRPSGVPNYYINGYFHQSIKVSRQGEKIVTESAWSKGKNILAEKPELIGLNPYFKGLLVDHVLKPLFNQRLAEAIKR